MNPLRRPAVVRLLCAASLVATLMPTAGADAALPAGNTAQQWNRIAEDTVVGSGTFQNEGMVYMAYVAAAVYDAVSAVDGRVAPLMSAIDGAPGASIDAAVIEAAYRTLAHYFPLQTATLDALHAEALAQLPDGSAKSDGVDVGMAAAAGLIADRTGDGRLTPIGTTSAVTPRTPGPGVWRLTAPFAPPQTPWVGAMRPFILESPDRFRPRPPVSLYSERWAREFNEMKLFGSATGSLRTPAQTAIARFWTANVIRQYNRVIRDLSAARSLDVAETARLAAMVNVVGADAQIAVMNAKYHFLFWRPVTAIDPTAVTADGFGPAPGFDDGNSATVEEIGWRSLAPVPNHPEYPAAHGSLTSAMVEVFSEFLGTEQIDIDIHGFDASGVAGNLDAVRHFDTAEQLRDEIVSARLWAGLHYRLSSEAGVELGRRVGRFDLRHAFRARR
jgi:hypothetical protein